MAMKARWQAGPLIPLSIKGARDEIDESGPLHALAELAKVGQRASIP
jgi:hypothetical protein